MSSVNHDDGGVNANPFESGAPVTTTPAVSTDHHVVIPAPDADSAVSKAMMELSLKDRNRFQEEIHGVYCLAPEESPEFLRESLEKLDLELNNPAIPSDEKRAFLESQELYAKSNIPSYVNSDDFRLRFLRCETFDVPIAALRIFKFLDLVSKLFGTFALQRPIRITDFSREELRIFRKGRYQLLPFRDRAGKHGRRILSVFPDEEWETITSAVRTKIWLYLTYVVGEDIEAQKSGMVVIIWFDQSWKNISVNPYTNPGSSRFITLGTRASSVHICTPDTPLHRFRRNVMLMRVGCEKCRIKIHTGNPVESRYILESFGIPSDYIPVSHTGTVKDKYVKEWIRLRMQIEQEQANAASSNNTVGYMIECPYLGDIIFRNGTSLTSHPANATLRCFVATMCNQEKNRNKTARDLVLDIFEELRVQNGGRGCRFLIWSEKGCYWKPVEPENEQKEIHKKIMRMVRETRNLNAKQIKDTSKLSSRPRTVGNGEASFMFLEGHKGQEHSPNKRQRVCNPKYFDFSSSGCF